MCTHQGCTVTERGEGTSSTARATRASSTSRPVRSRKGPATAAAARPRRVVGAARTASPSPEPAPTPPRYRAAGRHGLSAGGRRVAAWLTRRRTAPGRARSRPTRASTGSATRTAGSSTSARPRSCGQRLSSYFQDIARPAPRAPRPWCAPVPASSGPSSRPRSRRSSSSTAWIKEFDPRFNVRYRDDKSYPYLAVTLGEEFPRAQVMRGAKRKGTRYFGPYAHAWAIRETLDLLLRVFPMRTCSTGVFKRAGQVRPAVPARLHRQVLARRASAGSTPSEHREIAEDFCDFMAGETDQASSSALDRRDEARPPPSWTSSAPPACATTSAPSNRALEKSAVVLARRHRRRRVRPRRGRARGGRPGVPRPRRPGPRPARLGGREGRARTSPSWSSTCSSRSTAARPDDGRSRARCSCPIAARRRRGPGRVAQRAARPPRRPAGPAARRQARR